MTGALSWNVGKLFSELKLVTNNLLFTYAEANWEATDNWRVAWVLIIIELFALILQNVNQKAVHMNTIMW